MASFMKIPEKTVGLIARFNVFITAIAGTISYLLVSSSSLEKSGSTTHIITIALALSFGGVFGFPTGARMHSVVLAAERGTQAQKGFAIILSLLFISVACKLCGLVVISRVVVLGSGLFICMYLTYLTIISKRDRTY